jgi:hypothetical protein
MAKFKIPEQYLTGFETIAKLDGDQIENLSSIIKNIHAGIGYNSLKTLIVSELKADQAEAISHSLYSLVGFVTSEPQKLDDIVKELVSSFEESRKQQLLKIERENFVYILSEFFNNRNIKLTFKAINLLSFNDKTFRDGKIITDIRLLFDDDISSSERSAVIIHQLKIEYLEDDEVKDYYFSLDSTDLIKLQSQLERAIKKEEVIKNNYNETFSFFKLDD